MTLTIDPTANEMREFLRDRFDPYQGEFDDFDIEEAIYWFAYSWHGGGGSNLYAALSTSAYRPGPLTDGPEPGSWGAIMLEELEAEYDFALRHPSPA